jgi:hypothetical protein
MDGIENKRPGLSPALFKLLNAFQSRCDLIRQGLQEQPPLFSGCPGGKADRSALGIGFHPDGFQERTVRHIAIGSFVFLHCLRHQMHYEGGLALSGMHISTDGFTDSCRSVSFFPVAAVWKRPPYGSWIFGIQFLNNIPQKMIAAVSIDDDNVRNAGSFQRLDNIGNHHRQRMGPEGYAAGEIRMLKGSGVGKDRNAVRGLEPLGEFIRDCLGDKGISTYG